MSDGVAKAPTVESEWSYRDGEPGVAVATPGVAGYTPTCHGLAWTVPPTSDASAVCP